MICRDPRNNDLPAGASLPRSHGARSSRTHPRVWLLAVLALGLLAASCREESAAPGPDSGATGGPFDNDVDAIAAALALFIRAHQDEIPVDLKSLNGRRDLHPNEFLVIGDWFVRPTEPDGCEAECAIAGFRLAIVFLKKKQAKYEVVRFEVISLHDRFDTEIPSPVE